MPKISNITSFPSWDVKEGICKFACEKTFCYVVFLFSQCGTNLKKELEKLGILSIWIVFVVNLNQQFPYQNGFGIFKMGFGALVVFFPYLHCEIVQDFNEF